MRELLNLLYGETIGATAYARLEERLNAFDLPSKTQLPQAEKISEKDAILITYGDMVRPEAGREEAPLSTLARFLDQTVEETISTVHLLPFFPYSSDDGFSVIDYLQVDPALGSWADVSRVGHNFRLMFDAVINHISAGSRWFQGFLRDERPFNDYFVTIDPATDLSAVFRPRALPLLTPFDTPSGTKHVWTTFSADQIDLNYANPDVLLEVIDILLTYIEHGAEFIRLDAIGFMWKEPGTTSIHLPQTHAIIQLMRKVLDRVAPHVSLITETNVPHKDNISYFGDGTNEAQMVYNFSLPPLVLHAFMSGQATILSRWAAALEFPSDEVTFFNFLASHDGIGVTPARGYLSDAEITAMGERIKALGGHVSYKTNSDGSQTEYELNISYIDAMGRPGLAEDNDLRARRFVAAQAIMLALRGVPGIYFHSLFGSCSWPEGVEETGRFRTINRQKLEITSLLEELSQPDSLRAQVFKPFNHLLTVRTSQPAFHPSAPQQIVDGGANLFCVVRGSDNPIVCLHNVSASSQPCSLELTPFGNGPWIDLVSGDELRVVNGRLAEPIPPYAVIWLTPEKS